MCPCSFILFNTTTLSACWPADPAALRLEADTFLCPPPGLTDCRGREGGCCTQLISEEEEEAAGRDGTAHRPSKLLQAPATTAANPPDSSSTVWSFEAAEGKFTRHSLIVERI